MVYKVIGLMSGSSLYGLDVAYVELREKASSSSGPKGWQYNLVHTATYSSTDGWRQKLLSAPGLSAL